ncbi:hypothetical protein BFC20_11330 [Brochothrix thermosphacta]|uniref:hypothetical protein n=1 Tax=Brochothrix thermosphacta TaxID=2756 RepID=UPI000E7629EC|nr:hypothetical protein [Brochothrix thermosphacta]ANZ98251.1 hypothetical protein BFC20_11330 [Brochothrix thermosphacta]
MDYYLLPIIAIVLGFLFLILAFYLALSHARRITKLGFINLILIAVVAIACGLLLMFVFTGDLANFV